MDEKNIIMKDLMIVWTVRLLGNAIITAIFTIPTYCLLFSIVFYGYGLVSEMSFKCYFLVYSITYLAFLYLIYFSGKKMVE